MSAAGDDVVHGLRAAARVTGRSPSGVQKLVDTGKLAASKDDDGYTFAIADLEALAPPQRTAAGDITVPIADATSPTLTEPNTAASIAPDLRTSAHPDPIPAQIVGSGELAAKVFSLFESGQAPVEVVIATKEQPATVETLYATWLRLKTADLTSAGAQSRVTPLEVSVGELRGILDQLSTTVDAFEPTITEASTGVWEHHQAIESLLQRTAGLERRARFDGHAELRGLRQRLGAVEQAVRALPAAPLLIGQACGACGHALAVAACCTGCGTGRAAVG